MKLTDEQLEAFAAFVGVPVSPKTPLELTKTRVEKSEQKHRSVKQLREQFELQCETLEGDGPHDLTPLLWKSFLVGRSEMMAIYRSDSKPVPPWYSRNRKRFGILRVDEISGSSAEDLVLHCWRLDVGVFWPGDHGPGSWEIPAVEQIELPLAHLSKHHLLCGVREEDIIDLVRAYELDSGPVLQAGRDIQLQTPSPTTSRPPTARRKREMEPLNSRGCFFRLVTFPLIVAVTAAVAVRLVITGGKERSASQKSEH